MVKVVFEGTAFDIPKGKSLLDGLLDAGLEVPHGCKTGTCQSCLLKCNEGEIPTESQKGLRESQKLNRLFLACQCSPEQGMRVTLPLGDPLSVKAMVQSLRHLTPEIMEVCLKPERDLNYRAGQFIRLFNSNGNFRAYSLASVRRIDDSLTLHVREYPEGVLSSWVHHQLLVGDQVTISEPLGECFYIPGHTDQPILMIGTGSGLAPLYGILRDALDSGHQGPIHLFHGASTVEGIYLFDELNQLMAAYPNFHYQPCVSGQRGLHTSQILEKRASDIGLETHPNLRGWRVFLCGNPEMVRTTQMKAFLAGARLEEIHADPFDMQLSV